MALVRVETKRCRELVMDYHYASRMVGARYAFARLDDDGVIDGCVLFSIPASYTLCNGVCGEPFRKSVLELSRVVLRENKKLHASKMIAEALRELGDYIVVSYADPNVGHTGIVYQATNWIYTGQGNAEPAWLHPDTKELVSNTRRHIDRKAEALGLHWKDLIKEPREGKHRYVTFTGNRRFRKRAFKALRYDVQPYPKKGCVDGQSRRGRR